MFLVGGPHVPGGRPTSFSCRLWVPVQGNEGFWVEKAVSLRMFLAEAAATFFTQIKNFSLSRSGNPDALNVILNGRGAG
jgi:hypothetical protein